jgi:hypothetical protein
MKNRLGRLATEIQSQRKAAFEAIDYPVGNQRKAETLTGKHYFEGDFQPIVSYCKSAQVFQDTPFSYSETYKHLDQAYPGSKFILSVRDNPEQWCRSVTRFHAKFFGKNGCIPTAEDLKAAQYVWPGFMYNVIPVHGTTDEDRYNKDAKTAHYEQHNRDVMAYFKDRPNDLLAINVAEQGLIKSSSSSLGLIRLMMTSLGRAKLDVGPC